MAMNKRRTRTPIAVTRHKKTSTVTLHDRTTTPKGRAETFTGSLDTVVLTPDAQQRLLQEVKLGTHSAQVSGRQHHVVIDLTPRGTGNVDLVQVRTIANTERAKEALAKVRAEAHRAIAQALDVIRGHTHEEVEHPDSLDTALAEARTRGARRVAEILADPEMLSADAFGQYIGVSREAVRLKYLRREVLGLTGAKRGIRYPKWQLTDADQPLPGLPELFQALGGDPWTVYRFLLQHHPELDRETALSALKHGEWKRVLAAAENASHAFA